MENNERNSKENCPGNKKGLIKEMRNVKNMMGGVKRERFEKTKESTSPYLYNGGKGNA